MWNETERNRPYSTTQGEAEAASATSTEHVASRRSSGGASKKRRATAGRASREAAYAPPKRSVRTDMGSMPEATRVSAASSTKRVGPQM